MSLPQLVCPFDKELLAKLTGRAVVVRCDDISRLPEVEPYLADRHSLQAIVLESGRPLSTLLPLPVWGRAPLVLSVSEPGLFRAIDPYVKHLQSANLQIFMPAEPPENLAGLRILSSLGIACGLILDGCNPDWEKVSDLIHYAVYGKYPHAPIEPFSFVTRYYQPNVQIDFGAVYFDDPARYLHVDKDGGIAANARDLVNRQLIGERLADLGNVTENPRYQEALTAWRRFFPEEDGCAYCGAWRVCMGRFSGRAPDKACEKVFSDLMEAAEFVRSRQTRA